MKMVINLFIIRHTKDQPCHSSLLSVSSSSSVIVAFFFAWISFALADIGSSAEAAGADWAAAWAFLSPEEDRETYRAPRPALETPSYRWLWFSFCVAGESTAFDRIFSGLCVEIAVERPPSSDGSRRFSLLRARATTVFGGEGFALRSLERLLRRALNRSEILLSIALSSS